VADQSGRALELPPEERKSLIIAMSLHEKGRTALKNEYYALGKFLLDLSNQREEVPAVSLQEKGRTALTRE
jgi:hypothetical protein